MTESDIFLEPVVYVVDGSPESSRVVAELIQTFGYQVRLFDSQDTFLEAVDESRPGCAILDVRCPKINGVELQDQLKQRGIMVPVIVVTSSVDTPLTVRSLLSGAFTVIEKPIRDDELWQIVQEALQHSRTEFERQRHVSSLESRLKRLSPQDRAVLQLMLQGVKNRSIAKRLDVSLRTVENRRRRVFDLMQADSVAQLTRMVVEYEYNLPPAGESHDAWLSLPFEKVAC